MSEDGEKNLTSRLTGNCETDPQQKRVDNLTKEERRAWGFKEGETVVEKQKRDEEENPSKPSPES